MIAPTIDRIEISGIGSACDSCCRALHVLFRLFMELLGLCFQLLKPPLGIDIDGILCDFALIAITNEYGGTDFGFYVGLRLGMIRKLTRLKRDFIV